MVNFSINGRFLAQKATGVQRYATEVTKAIDILLGQEFRHLTGRIIVPAGIRTPEFENLDVVTVGKRVSFLWEQYDLPRAARGTLVCLGNTGPILYRNKIVCIHGANYKFSPQSYSYLFERYIRTIVPLMAKTSRRIASVSHYSAQLLSETYGISAEKIIVAVNGFEHALSWQADHSDVADRFPMSKDFVLLVGSLAQHKNWALITQIAREINRLGLQIVAVGSGGNEFNQSGAIDTACFLMLGRVSDDDLAWLYQNARMMLFPSIVEGFGLPLVEAMACGCPVVSSNTSSMPEVAGSAAVLLSPAQPDDWLAAIRKLYADPESLDAMRETGREQVRQFSWARTAEIYLRYVEEQKQAGTC